MIWAELSTTSIILVNIDIEGMGGHYTEEPGENTGYCISKKNFEVENILVDFHGYFIGSYGKLDLENFAFDQNVPILRALATSTK